MERTGQDSLICLMEDVKWSSAVTWPSSSLVPGVNASSEAQRGEGSERESSAITQLSLLSHWRSSQSMFKGDEVLLDSLNSPSHGLIYFCVFMAGVWGATGTEQMLA